MRTDTVGLTSWVSEAADAASVNVESPAPIDDTADLMLPFSSIIIIIVQSFFICSGLFFFLSSFLELFRRLRSSRVHWTALLLSGFISLKKTSKRKERRQCLITRLPSREKLLTRLYITASVSGSCTNKRKFSFSLVRHVTAVERLNAKVKAQLGVSSFDISEKK